MTDQNSGFEICVVFVFFLDLRQSRAEFEQNPNRMHFDDAENPRPPGIPVSCKCYIQHKYIQDQIAIPLFFENDSSIFSLSLQPFTLYTL